MRSTSAITLCLFLAASPALAATKVWLGNPGQTGKWSAGSNWQDGKAPVNGDRLQFTSATLWPFGENDISGLVLDGMDFNASTNNAQISGRALTLSSSSPITFTDSAGPVLALPLVFAAQSPLIMGTTGPHGSPQIDFRGGMNLSGGTTTISSPGAVFIEGQVSQPGSSVLSVIAPVLQMYAEMDSGSLRFLGGTLFTNASLGVGQAMIQADQYRIDVNGQASVTTPLLLSAPNGVTYFQLEGQSAPIRFTGPIALGSGTYVFEADQSTIISSTISGTGRLTVNTTSLAAPGPSLTLTGSNSFSGGTSVNLGGKLVLASPFTLPLQGDLYVMDSQSTVDIVAGDQPTAFFTCRGRFEVTLGAALHSSGNVDLNGCSLQVDPSTISLPRSTPITLISTGTTLTGAFTGLPEGATVNVNGVAFTLTYQGGSGHDVALIPPGATAPQPPPPPQFVYMESQQGEPTLNGASALLTTDSGPWDMQLRSAGNTFLLVGPPKGQLTPGWSFGFWAPDGSALAVGRYANATSFLTPTAGRPYIDVFQNVSSCRTERQAGNFEILELETSNNAVTKFAVDFDRECDGTPYALYGGLRYHSVLPYVPPSGHQDMWWNPSENGWGMSLVQHNDTLFGALYIYDVNGNPTWVVMPGGNWNSTHTAYSGSVYAPKGTPYFAYNAAAIQVGNAVGAVTLTFQDANNASLDYTVNGVTGHKSVTRQIFANGAATSPRRSDLWWGGSSQNGWGITVLQQADTLFAVWYTYDAIGNPAWYVMPGGSWTATGTYEGTLYRTTGAPWVGRTYDPAKLQVAPAGTFRLQFNGDAATFTYSADGHTATVPLSREPF